MPGSKRKSTTTSRSSHRDNYCGRKRIRDDDSENRSSNIMHAKEDNTHVRKLKKGIKAVRKSKRSTADPKEASKQFFRVTSDQITTTNRFTIDVSKIGTSHKNKMSSIFGKAEQEYLELCKNEDNTEALDEANEFEFPTETVYTNPRLTQELLGQGVKITLEFENAKVRRNIDVSKEVSLEEEDEEDKNEAYKLLHEKLKAIEEKYRKPAEEIADVFVKVSGDFTSLERYFQGENVVLWTYLEDLALTKPEDSMEYKCLMESKGRHEIEKRKNFLLKSQQEGPDDY